MAAAADRPDGATGAEVVLLVVADVLVGAAEVVGLAP